MKKTGPSSSRTLFLFLVAVVAITHLNYLTSSTVNANYPVQEDLPPVLMDFEAIHIFSDWYFLNGSVNDEAVEYCDVVFDGIYTGTVNVSSDGTFSQAVQISNVGTISAVALDDSAQISNLLSYLVNP